MLVDSSGSRKPLARPIATTFLFQIFLRMPVVNLSGRGSARARPSRLFSSVAAASSSLMYALEYTYPFPVRCCNGMRHCQPAARAVERVYGVGGPTFSHGTARARSHGNQCVQSS